MTNDERDAEARGWQARLLDDGDEIIPLVPKRGRPVRATSGEPVKSGILNIDKPDGRTSHDVVQAVRRASGVRRVGHAGTLDPSATGVLVVCIGSATRVIAEIQAGRKAYRARVTLGAATTTYDSTGETVARHDPSGVTRADVEAALAPFRGDILQQPPMYSALKHKGRRLYELAREGVEIEREPRPVTVEHLELIDWDPPDVSLEMTVSRGTYVRSIAHDLGARLGVGGHLSALERTAVGRFTIEEAVRLPRVVEAFVEGWWPSILQPLDAALVDLSAMVIDEADETAIRHGQQVVGPPPGAETTALVRAYDGSGRLVALMRWDDIHARWQPDRVFPKPE
jgi:tRNA pseudouridine55 synthase